MFKIIRKIQIEAALIRNEEYTAIILQWMIQLLTSINRKYTRKVKNHK